MTSLMSFSGNNVFILGGIPNQTSTTLPLDLGPDLKRVVCGGIRIEFRNTRARDDQIKNYIILKIDFKNVFLGPSYVDYHSATFDLAVAECDNPAVVEEGYELTMLRMVLRNEKGASLSSLFSVQLAMKEDEEIRLGDVICAIEKHRLLRYLTRKANPTSWANQDYFSKVVEALSTEGCIEQGGKIKPGSWRPHDPIFVKTAAEALQQDYNVNEWSQFRSIELLEGKPFEYGP